MQLRGSLRSALAGRGLVGPLSPKSSLKRVKTGFYPVLSLARCCSVDELLPFAAAKTGFFAAVYKGIAAFAECSEMATVPRAGHGVLVAAAKIQLTDARGYRLLPLCGAGLMGLVECFTGG